MSLIVTDTVLDPEIYNNADTVVDTSKRLPFYALVIGIDDYQEVSKLSGATADADDMDRFLQTHLNVPARHIINLRDNTATREGIIGAFRSLQNNPEINRDDAIFIYFAGHGSEKEAPEGWGTPGSKIQVLLPQDVGMLDPQQLPIPPIPDRTFAALLNDLAESKGNNITVVLDCCHSSSGTRDDDNIPERVARVAELPYELPENMDIGLYSEENGRSMNTPVGFLERNLRSHVLLAACGAEELAYENIRLKRGAFTTAFVQTLIDAGVDKLTYTGFMDRLPNLPKQNPQCEGYYRDRMLFNGKLPGADRRFIGVEKKGSTYVLKGGTAQGVAVDSEFTIHASHTGVSLANPPLCRMRAKEVSPFRTVLEPIDNITTITIPKPAYAREVLCGTGQELRVHFSEALERVVGVPALQRAAHSTNEPNFGFIVSDVDSAEMIVDIEDTSDGRCVTFSTTLEHATQHQYRKLPHNVPPDAEDLCKVLRAAARWNHHFKRTNHPRFIGSISLEFYRLDENVGEFDDAGMLILNPANNENMNRTGVVDLVVKEDHYYGVKIVNDSKIDLYPYLFYFDLSDQCIEPYYLSQKGRDRVDPPLRAGSSLTVGYGEGGEVPFAFHLRSGEKIDVGFLKLFVTTSPTDFDSLKQSSPFDIARGALPRTDTIRRLKQSSEDTEQWGAVLTAIVQRSHPRDTETPPDISPEASSVHLNGHLAPPNASSTPPSASPTSSDAPSTPLNTSPIPPKESSMPPKESPIPPKESPIPPKESPTPPKESPVPPKDSSVPLSVPPQISSQPTPGDVPVIPPIPATHSPDVSSLPPPITSSSSRGWFAWISDCFKCFS